MHLVSKPWKQGSSALQVDHILHDYKADFILLGMNALVEVPATYNSQLIYFVFRGTIIQKKKM